MEHQSIVARLVCKGSSPICSACELSPACGSVPLGRINAAESPVSHRVRDSVMFGPLAAGVRQLLAASRMVLGETETLQPRTRPLCPAQVDTRRLCATLAW